MTVEGKAIKNANELVKGDKVSIRFSEGEKNAEIL